MKKKIAALVMASSLTFGGVVGAAAHSFITDMQAWESNELTPMIDKEI